MSRIARVSGPSLPVRSARSVRRIEPFQILSHIVLAVLSMLSIAPFALLTIASFTAEKTILRDGYSFWPATFSLDAYNYLISQASMIGRGYLITIGVTVVGTAISLVITSMVAYPLSRPDLAGRKIFAFLVFFTMLFNGGLVPTYFLYAKYLMLKNTLFALLIPGLLMNGFNVLLMRTFFKTNIPEAVIESATIDGAGKFRTFVSIVLPLSYPILATVGLFVAIAYWNDWFNGLIYITKPKLFSIQNILNRIMTDIQFLSNSNLGTHTSADVANIPTTAVRMAIAVVGVIPMLAAYPFFQKYFVKGITVGAVKG